MLERFETVVRENEMLRAYLEEERAKYRHLALGIGHTAALIDLAKTVVRLRDGRITAEKAHPVMFDIVTRWEAS
jgi:hypothetical protein